MTALQTTRRLPRWLARALRITLFAALTAIGAKISIFLPFTPVPITLQVLFVLTAGLTLGPKEGFASQIVYLSSLAIGLPLDSQGLGAVALVGATAGYLWAFPFAAAVAGLGAGPFGSDSNLKLVRRLVAGLVGVLVIYLTGVSVLSAVINESWLTAWTLGASPFIAVDAGKLLLAASGVSGIEQLWTKSKSTREYP